MLNVKTNNADPALKNPQISKEELHSVFLKAKAVQSSWKQIGLNSRIAYLRQVQRYLIKNIDAVVNTISDENGKLRIDALAAEVIPISIAVKYYCKTAPKVLADKKITPATFMLSFKRSYVSRLPYGVVGIISPWNYPFTIPMFEIIPALLAGNTVILKAAAETQNTAKIIEEAFSYAGLPDGVFNNVSISGKVAGKALLEFGVNKLSFTGSVAVGKELSRLASNSLTPLNLELGGNDAMIVCEDADIDKAVKGAIWGAFHNSGQSCGAIERIYAHSKIYDEFTEKLKSKVEALVAGDDKNFAGDLGYITTYEQYSAIQSHLEDAVAKGAKIFAQSKISGINSKLVHPATVLTKVNNDMKVMTEETFGPLVCVVKVNSVEEAVRLTNDSNLGLSASVWTQNLSSGRRIARNIQAGVVNINDHLMSHGLVETPWGGMKESGNSRTHGEDGLLNMTQSQVVVRDLLKFSKRNLWWHPYSEKLYTGLKGMLLLLFGSGFKERFNGLISFIKIVPRIFK